MKFKKEEIENLDKVLNLVIRLNQQVTSVDYAKEFDLPHNTEEFVQERENELRSYAVILESYDAIKLKRLKYGYYLSKSDLSDFIVNNGGFKTIFDENQKKINDEDNDKKLVSKSLGDINWNRSLFIISIIINILFLLKDFII